MPKAKTKTGMPFGFIGIIVGVGIPLLTFTGTVLVKIWSIADSIATKVELVQLRTQVIEDFKRTDEAIAKSVAASKVYTDEKATQIRTEAFNYSDKDKADMKTDTAEIRGQLNVILGVLNNVKVEKRH